MFAALMLGGSCGRAFAGFLNEDGMSVTPETSSITEIKFLNEYLVKWAKR
jgi:hypothetical protein